MPATITEAREQATALQAAHAKELARIKRHARIYRLHRRGRPLDSYAIRFELDPPTQIVTDGPTLSYVFQE